jgi:hypothetical protein
MKFNFIILLLPLNQLLADPLIPLGVDPLVRRNMLKKPIDFRELNKWGSERKANLWYLSRCKTQ